jgi:hypothetical protein
MGQTCIVVNSHLALLVVIADVRIDIILVWGKPGSVDSRGQWDKEMSANLVPGVWTRFVLMVRGVCGM